MSGRKIRGNLAEDTIQDNAYIVVVAKSARMLAQAAHKAGLKPLVIDLWGDQDTRCYAEELVQIPTLASEDLSNAVNYFLDRYPLSCGIYGSGFEQHPDSLEFLVNRLTLLGNSPETFMRLQDKPGFFSSLKTLGIPYPEVSFNPPDQATGWLIKPMQSQGGVGIRRYSAGGNPLQFIYWQEFQEGEPHSVLFLADGKRCQIVGFNRQWTVALDEFDEFIFSGIINNTALSHKQKNQLSAWVAKLVVEYSLKGLNSLDFIQDGNNLYVLEINARPPASMELYGDGLLIHHIKTCQGELADYKQSQQPYIAYQILYAQQDLRIPDDFGWPTGAGDLPHAGSIIRKGQPICSMITQSQEPGKALEQLQTSQALIINKIHRLQTHGIQPQRQ